MPFKNISSYANDNASNFLEVNLRIWLEDCFLRIGAYTENVDDILLPDQNKQGRYIGSFRNWAYKIYKQDTWNFTPPTVQGPTGYSVDYPNGAVNYTVDPVLPQIPVTYTAGRVSIRTATELGRPPMVMLERESRNENYSSVFQDLDVQEQIQLPYIILEAFPTGAASPYQLGSQMVRLHRRIQVNVVTESLAERSKILDIINAQSYKTVRTFDTNKTCSDQSYANGRLPLIQYGEKQGDVNPDGLHWEDLVNTYPSSSVKWDNITTRVYKTKKQDVFVGIASFTCEVVSSPHY
jgi:hypothetical protein